MAHMVESSTDAIIILRPDRKIGFLNRAAEALLGFSAKEACDRKPVDLWLSADISAQYDDDLQRIAAGKFVEHFESVWCHRDGTPVHVSISMSAIRNNDGALLGISLVVRDVRIENDIRRRQWELKVRLLEAACLSKTDRLIATLVHELNTPLANINLLAESIETRAGDVTKAAVRIGEQVDRAVGIMRRTRDGENGQLRRKFVAINSLIHDAVNSVLLAFKPSNIETSFELEDVPPLRIDQVQIEQVIINLVRNALEAMQERGGRLIVSCKRINDEVQITVADEGPGISEELMSQLFQPYVTTKPNGLGIGLALSQEIVRAHAGDLYIQAERDIGTCFVVSVPLALSTGA